MKCRFGIVPAGNAPSDPQGEFTGKNLLYVAAGIDELAQEFGKTASDIEGMLSAARLAMFRAFRRPARLCCSRGKGATARWVCAGLGGAH